ncbi:DNA-processing protein DprA [Candidatus Saccharibacteria bacterium]|nr:DNA-processing protein DprA [Candidatus Saccharibacteria bacterium]
MSILFINLGYLANILLMIISQLQTSTYSQTKALSLLPQAVNELFYAGDLLKLLEMPKVAIVGSRKLTNYGRFVTEKLARELARNGVVIVSGLALGIDSVAHRTALEENRPTIAVLPTGLEKIYPYQHHYLAKQIVDQGGALVSEYPAEQTTVMKYQFIARNRIIASLSQVVIITEAAKKSGSLHTAQFALDQGIDIFAVPGKIIDQNSVGTNDLIKQGAQILTSAQDVLEILNIKPTNDLKHKNTDPIQQKVVQLLKGESMTIQNIHLLSNINLTELQQAITLLELNGIIQSTDGYTWTLAI